MRSRLIKLVRMVVARAPRAAYSGDLLNTAKMATKTAKDIK